MHIPEFDTAEQFTAFKRQLHQDMATKLRYYATQIPLAAHAASRGEQPLIDGDIIPPASGARIYLDMPINGIQITLNWNTDSDTYQLVATTAGIFTATHPVDPADGATIFNYWQD